MILRPRPHWVRMLFVLRGTVLPAIAPQLLVATGFAAIVTLLHSPLVGWKLSLNIVPFSL